MSGAARPAVDGLRKLKHTGFVARKKLRPRAIEVRDFAFRRYDRVRPYRFDLDRYRDPRGSYPFDFFLHRSPEADMLSPGLPPPHVIRCFWTGDNPLTPNRVRGLDILRADNPTTPVDLVTPERVARLVVDGHPLHPAYEFLSAVHRSDYLRAYVSHHRGGGYSDIKPSGASWESAFEQFSDPQVWFVGYPEVDSDICANLGGRLVSDLQRHFASLCGNGAFVVRPRTPLTAEWLAEVHRRLDYHLADLQRHPATDPYGTNADYPVTWIGIMSNVLHPLQLKYLPHLRHAPELTPSFTDYR